MGYITIVKYTVRHPYEWPVISRERYDVLKRYPNASSFIEYNIFRYAWNWFVCLLFILMPIGLIGVVVGGNIRSDSLMLGSLWLFIPPLLILLFSPDWPSNYFRYVGWVHKQRRHAKWIVAVALESSTYEEFCEAYDTYRGQFRT